MTQHNAYPVAAAQGNEMAAAGGEFDSAADASAREYTPDAVDYVAAESAYDWRRATIAVSLTAGVLLTAAACRGKTYDSSTSVTVKRGTAVYTFADSNDKTAPQQCGQETMDITEIPRYVYTNPQSHQMWYGWAAPSLSANGNCPKVGIIWTRS